MNPYVTAAAIKTLREQKGMTQAELAEMIGVTDKAVSKWETAKGLPDISLLEPLAAALGASLPELINGSRIINQNRCGNMLRTKFYVCPVCGNVIHSTGETVACCCGITLPALEAEEADEEHALTVENVEDEYFVSVRHEMTKEHYISFIAWVTGDRLQLVRLYPEGNAEARLQRRGSGELYFYCNRHGLFKQRI